MPRKAKTKEDLQKEIRQLKRINEGQERQIQELINENDSLRNGIDVQLQQELKRAYKEIEYLKKLIEGQGKQIKRLRRKHNERGTGRKAKADEKQTKEILKLRGQGYSYQKIAKETDLSVGTVFNIVKNNSQINK